MSLKYSNRSSNPAIISLSFVILLSLDALETVVIFSKKSEFKPMEIQNMPKECFCPLAADSYKMRQESVLG